MKNKALALTAALLVGACIFVIEDYGNRSIASRRMHVDGAIRGRNGQSPAVGTPVETNTRAAQANEAKENAPLDSLSDEELVSRLKQIEADLAAHAYIERANAGNLDAQERRRLGELLHLGNELQIIKAQRLIARME